jgi:hypothetical protein
MLMDRLCVDMVASNLSTDDRGVVGQILTPDISDLVHLQKLDRVQDNLDERERIRGRLVPTSLTVRPYRHRSRSLSVQ